MQYFNGAFVPSVSSSSVSNATKSSGKSTKATVLAAPSIPAPEILIRGDKVYFANALKGRKLQIYKYTKKKAGPHFGSGENNSYFKVDFASTENVDLNGNIQSLDGVRLENNRVLLKDQTDKTQNGLYDVNYTPDYNGDGDEIGRTYTWTVADGQGVWPTNLEIVSVKYGNINAGTGWYQRNENVSEKVYIPYADSGVRHYSNRRGKRFYLLTSLNDVSHWNPLMFSERYTGGTYKFSYKVAAAEGGKTATLRFSKRDGQYIWKYV